MKDFIVNKLIYVIIIIALGFGGYWWYFNKDVVSAIINPTDSEKFAADSQQAIDLLALIDSIEFDTTIFDTTPFRSLQDIRMVTTNEPIGRTDPFANYSTSVKDIVTTASASSESSTSHNIDTESDSSSQ